MIFAPADPSAFRTWLRSMKFWIAKGNRHQDDEFWTDRKEFAKRALSEAKVWAKTQNSEMRETFFSTMENK